MVQKNQQRGFLLSFEGMIWVSETVISGQKLISKNDMAILINVGGPDLQEFA